MNKKTGVFVGTAVFAVFLIVSVFAYGRLQDGAILPENLLLTEQSGEEIQSIYDFVVFDGDGNEVRFSDFSGQPVVLNFWTTWCPACVRSSPYFDQLYLETDDSVHILKINLPGGRETRQAVDNFMYTNGYSFPVYFDLNGDAARTFGIRSIPDTIFINADGQITARIVGAVNERTLQQGMDSF